MKTPELGERLPSAGANKAMLEALALRRSTPADCLGEPGPDQDELELILHIAARAPDHRRVTPFRFIIFEGKGREKFGEALKTAFLKHTPEATPERAEIERKRFLRAGVVVAVVSHVDHAHKTPEWEQVLTAGAVSQNMLLAARASGYAAQWLTEWYAYDANILAALGLADNERIAGFIYLGTAREDPKERGRPDLSALIERY